MTTTTQLRQESPPRVVPTEKMPGHWLLARMGKRVLRPGGLQLTHRMLEELNISCHDDVVEFAPGLGVTARLTLEKNPASYRAVERDQAAAATVRKYLTPPRQQCVIGSAEDTGLPSESASIVYGEAMLSMQPPPVKARIVAEAARLLRPGGRYAIHELCLVPDDVSAEVREEIERALSSEIHVGVRPLTRSEWRHTLKAADLTIVTEHLAPMHLLEPARLIQDEGLFRAMRFVWNVARDPQARKRITAMRRLFRKFRDHLSAIVIIAVKPPDNRCSACS